AAAINAFEAGDLPGLVGDQGLPVGACFAHRPAIAGRIPDMFGELRCVDAKLLRHAAAHDAGSPDAVFLGDGYPLAERGRDTTSAYAARPAAEDEKIEVEFGHGGTPLARDWPHLSASSPKEKPGQEAGLGFRSVGERSVVGRR